MPTPTERPILDPGRTCWQVAEAGRAAVLIDASAYFAALETALAGARRSVVIVGWDFDGRIRLRPDRPGGPESALGPYLRSLVELHPELEIRILVWSVAVLHTSLAPLQLLGTPDWQDHPRIRLRLDTRHPLYGAHHQKIVCIDGVLAFAGGIDLTARRWDRPIHDPEDPLRIDPDGRPYGPVHDMQMLVDRDAARAVCGVATERWRRATGDPLPDPGADDHDPWPAGLEPDFRGIGIGIARTIPAWDGASEHKECAALTAAALGSARRLIYLEAQYLSAPFVADILAEALARPDGPEVVALVTEESHGLIEKIVMGGNRNRLLRRLKRADRHGRLRAYHPVVPSRAGDCEVLIHAKVVLVDDVFLRIGSSNLNNRSIGLDTECDLALEARDVPDCKRIEGLLHQLLAEHLGTQAATVTAAIDASGGSVVRALDRLNVGPRGLKAFRISARGPARPLPGTALLDPSEPPGPISAALRRWLSGLSAGRLWAGRPRSRSSRA